MKDNYSVIGIRVICWKEPAEEEFEDISGFIGNNIGVYTLEDKVRPITDEEFGILTSHYPGIGELADFAVIEVHVVTWKDSAGQDAKELEDFARESVGILVLDADVVPLTDDEWEACIACDPERFL